MRAQLYMPFSRQLLRLSSQSKVVCRSDQSCFPSSASQFCEMSEAFAHSQGAPAVVRESSLLVTVEAVWWDASRR